MSSSSALLTPPQSDVILDPGDPLISAEIFVEKRYTKGRERTLQHHRGDFYCWNGTRYEGLEDNDLEAQVWRFLHRAFKYGPKASLVPFRPTRSKVAEVFAGLQAECHLSSSTCDPAWLDDTVDLPPSEIISCANGLLHLPSGDLLPHTPAMFNRNGVSFAYDDHGPEPIEFLRFLEQLWPEDPDAIATLQQIFGYLLTGNTSHQKAFIIVGPPRSGKGTIARVLTALLGQTNVVSPTLNSLVNNFGLMPLLGKSLAIIPDARLSCRTDQQQIMGERILSITGEDAQTVDRKYKDPWTGKLPTRLLILSNELPQFADASGALANRFIILTLKRSFLGREDHGLIGRILLELPGILNWAIRGWKDLRMQGRFATPASSADVAQEILDLASPVSAFIRDVCEIGPGNSVRLRDLVKARQIWSQETGNDYNHESQTFGRDLRAAIPGIRLKQVREGHKRERFYEGIALG